MFNDDELIYYCLLHCDYALNMYYKKYQKYVWGMVNRISLPAFLFNHINDFCQYQIRLCLYSYNSRKNNSFKTFIVTCINHRIARYRKLYQKDRYYWYDSVNLHQDFVYNGKVVSDDNDPQYYDSQLILQQSLDYIYNQLDTKTADIYDQYKYNFSLSRDGNYQSNFYYLSKLRKTIKNYMSENSL